MCSRSSFDGRISEIPYISVDNFEYVARAYFISHHHSDHIVGLYAENLLNVLQETRATIYCSELTAAIVEHECRVRGVTALSKYVRGLEYGSTLITLPSFTSLDGIGTPAILVTLTLIPAGHCAGSTMFLFKTPQTNILFTGDFRININDLPKYEALHVNGEPIKLETLYLDTTFLDIEYQEFPKRSESIDMLIQEMEEFLNNDGLGIAVHTSAAYGYEFVFNEIFKKLGVKVYVDDTKWDFYGTVQNLVPGVTNDEGLDKIHLCKHKTENEKHDCVATDYKEYLYIHLSAMKWTQFKKGDCPVKRINKNRIDVCFPTHCSAKELIYFKTYFKPGKAIGFPKTFKHLVFENGEMKACRADKKVDSELLKLLFG